MTAKCPKKLTANKPVGSAERVKLKPLASVVLLKKTAMKLSRNKT